MRQIVALALCHLWCVVSVVAATQPIYVNNSPVQVLFRPQVAPQIDATAFVNQSLFQINDIYFTGLPYQTFNTLYFTNTSSGNILGDMGYRFDFSSGNTRGPMYSWLNDQGTISGDTFLLVSERTPVFGFMEPGYDPAAIMAARVSELVTVGMLGSFLLIRRFGKGSVARW